MATHETPFAKAHGLGNDFLIIEEAHLGGRDAGAFARRACDRYTGVGADGLVVLGASPRADASFRIFNSDGSEASLSGNALRCAAAWIASRKATPPERIALDTRVGLRELFFLRREGGAWVFRSEIGRPAFRAAAVPFRPAPHAAPQREPIIEYPLPIGDVTLPVTVLWMGNPQCIHLLDNWDLLDWRGVGAVVEVHPYFPDRTNVGFVRVVSSERIEARFWERGAGHTLASGTGSCACAVAAHLAGKTKRSVTVSVERGELDVNWREDSMVELTGPAEIIATGAILLEG